MKRCADNFLMGGDAPERMALLLVDVQKGFDDPRWGQRNNPGAEGRMARLLGGWRTRGLPIIHVQHCSMEARSPLRPDQPGVTFKDETAPRPGELIVRKQVNSAFIGTTLEQSLRKLKIDGLVVVGFTTDHCVSTTVRMAGNLGFRVLLAADATATFDRKGLNGQIFRAEDVHQVHLASLQGEFCSVRSSEEILGGRVEGPRWDADADAVRCGIDIESSLPHRTAAERD